MPKIKLTINCCLCPKKSETEVEVAEGWISEEVDSTGFCPEHALV
jgi:hypothetical protein